MLSVDQSIFLSISVFVFLQIVIKVSNDYVIFVRVYLWENAAYIVIKSLC